ncbi:MAG: SBBP repeat-containing protein, partial [Ignavibacteria bacterium]
MKPEFYYVLKGFFLVFILTVIAPPAIYSQVSEEWTKAFESEESFDLVNDITVDNSGNIYITGYSSFDPDILTVKYNPSGDVQWAKNYNSPDDESDIGEAVAVDNFGNVYVAGNTRKGSGSESQDIILIKYNPDGDTLWVRRFNGNADDFDLAADAALDNDGNIYITGESTDSSSDENITTIKYDPSGNQQWVKFYNGSGDNVDEAKAIFVDGSDNIYVTGYSRNGPFTADGDLTTIKYNSAGEEQWVGIFDQDDEFDGGVSVAADAAGNVYAAGTTTSSSLNQDFVVVKYNSSGMEQWAKLYNGTGNSTDNGVKVAVDNQQNVYVTGNSQATSTFGRNDIITLKYNSNGDVQFTKTYDAAGHCDNADD